MESLSNATTYRILWSTYLVLLVSATIVAFKKSKSSAFLSANGTQTAIPLALNFIASGIGCGSLSAYPQIANIDGIHGLLVYALAGGLPMFVFAFLGPIIKKRAPNGFVLTEWIFQRFGLLTGWYFSLCSLSTVFLFMVSDVASLHYAISSISDINFVYVIIVQALVTTIYTSFGGFHISFITDSLQVAVVFVILLIVSCAMGKYIEIDPTKIEPSGLLKSNELGWQLVYILTLAIFTNDFFMSGFWLRTFAAKTDRDLLIGCSIACVVLTIFAVVVGFSGLIAVWAGYMDVADKENSGGAFFILLSQMPKPIVGFTLIFIITLSTCTFDSLQSALVSSISNDLFRNRISMSFTRVLVALVMIPVVLIGLMAEDILKIYLFVDLLSSSVVPVLVLGLNTKLDNYLSGWEVVGGGFGGLLCVWLFGAIYYSSIKEGFHLLFISKGLYVQDWSTFGAFVAAPCGALMTAFCIMFTRLFLNKAYNDRGSSFHGAAVKIRQYLRIEKLNYTIGKWEAALLQQPGSILLKDDERLVETPVQGRSTINKLTSTASSLPCIQ